MRWHGLAGWVASYVVKLWGGTLRWEVVDEAGYMSREVGRPLLVAVWHNRIFVLPLCYRWICTLRRPLIILTSPSRDGGLLASLMTKFGIKSVRGSSSRRGVVALRELQAELRVGQHDVAITPDGPRGPAYQLSPGLVYLAQRTGTPVMVIRVEYAAYWELRSWDKFRIPKPFSKVRMHFLPLHQVNVTDGPEAFEAERQRLEELLGR
jgi:lysophospholipid acyltransferase (LPLAT)-like uncharacterized protein